MKYRIDANFNNQMTDAVKLRFRDAKIRQHFFENIYMFLNFHYLSNDNLCKSR